MGEKKIVVPEDMIRAACKGTFVGQDIRWSPTVCHRILESAMRWLSENPIVPTEAQTDAMAGHFSSDDSLFGTFARWFAVEWQRRMFLAPEPDVLVSSPAAERIVRSMRGVTIRPWEAEIILSELVSVSHGWTDPRKRKEEPLVNIEFDDEERELVGLSMKDSASLVKPSDVLNQGDMYWGEDTDATGSEQSGDRIWIVMSRRALNGNNTIVVVPATTKMAKADEYPAFCIRLPAQEQIPIIGQSPSINRVALCHQVRVFDKSRLREKWGKLSLSAIPSIQLGLQYVFDFR